MFRLRPFVVFFFVAVALCLFGFWRSRSQTGGLRRVTITTDEGINVNPSLSGDGRRIAFESTEDLAHAGGPDHFRAIRADISSDTAVFTQMAATRAPAPGISHDGSRITFASKDDPLGTNSDGNSEIFLYDGATLRQVTNTAPNDMTARTRDGNFQPSLTEDGRFIAFSSNRNLTNQNPDGNLEIFVFDTSTNTFAQLTNTTGTVGASDAKISGDGSRVAYIRDNGVGPSTERDLVLQERVAGTVRVLASNVTNLAFTYGRAISDDGLRVVYSADVVTDSSQVFLFDGRVADSVRQITSLGLRTTEIPLHPTISPDGTRIAFATRRAVTGFSNGDASIELYTYDLPTGSFARITNAPSTADGFNGSTRVAEVVSSLNDDGSIVAFNFPRALSGAVTTGTENNSEIYVTATATRPTVGALKVLNGASFGNEPSTTRTVAPNSIAVAEGGALSFTTAQAQKQSDGSFPTTLGGTTVTVNSRAAQIFFVSPTQVNFLVPAQTEIGTATVTVTNSEGFQSRGTVTTLRAAPGIFTYSGDGLGEAVVLTADTLQPGPFDPSSGNLRLIIFTTGVRGALSQVTATAGGRALTVESSAPSPDMAGMDEVHVLVPTDLRGAGPVSLVVRADNRDSNGAVITFSGNACRDIVINEVLADPPDGSAGDANLDGVRNSNDDEFVELVNTTSNNIEIGGYQLLSRSSSSTTDTVRHTFPSETLFPAGSAIVVFGGGHFNPNNPAFGGAQVFKASSGGLSLTNSGGVLTLRTPAQEIVNIFSYGGSTGLDGDANQSLTRSPDAVGGTCGNFVLHTTAQGSNGRAFSPGTRADGSFFATGVGRLSGVTISPPSSSITRGQTKQFTAQAKDQFNRPMTGVTITFASDNTGVATVDAVSTDPATGIATATLNGQSAGTVHIMAQATDGGTTVNSSRATLTVNEPPPVVTRVEVSPSGPAINRGQTQQFSATAFDQNNQPIAGASFTWSSSNTNIATINANGVATGVGLGSAPITASTTDATGNTTSGTATLSVQVPLVINEILADPPDGIAGDSNRDSVRDGDDDEFVELVNSSGAPVDISGVIVADSTSNRFTFPANTTLAAGRAVLIFGGGSPVASDPAFGGALIFTTSTLSLGNTADTVNVKLTVGGTDVLIASQTYGSEGNDNQSLARSPDLSGAFAKHSTVANSDGRLFSPGTRTDGTPFGSPALTRIEVTPTSSAINVGQTQGFTARAFSNTNGTEVEVQNVSFVWDSTDATMATVPPTTGQSTTATALASGITSIRARAGGQQGVGNLSVNPTLSINDVSLNEGNSGTTTFTFTVSLSTPAPTGGVKFNIATQDGTATVADNDYVARSLVSQIIPAGSQTYTFDVAVNGDINIEPNETFFVNVTNLTGASISKGQGAGTILNDDSPSLSINDVSKNEGNSGTTTFTFIVSSTLPAPAGGITFDISTQDGTATTANNDYVAKSLTGQAIPAGSQTYTFDVTVNGDTLVEPDETFFVNITNVSGASVNKGQGQGTVQNDDAPLLVISQIYPGGGLSSATYKNDFIEIFNRGTNAVNFAATPFSVQFLSTSGTTWSKTDITSGTIAPGQYFLIQEASGGSAGAALQTPDATGTINLTSTLSGKVALVSGTTLLAANCPGDDGAMPFNPANSTIIDFVGYGGNASTPNHCYEGTEPATYQSGNNTIADFRKNGGCTDTNDNAADFIISTPSPRNTSSPLNNCGAGTHPNLSINDVQVTEGNSGTVTATFTVSLSAPQLSTDVTFDIATADNTATTANSDYVPRSLTNQVIPAGQQTYTFSVTVNGDTAVEPDETFNVNVSNVSGAKVLKSQGTGTIKNDDLPTLSINDVSKSEGGAGTTTTFTFTLSLSAPAPADVTFDVATADGTATTADNDYVANSLTGQKITAGNQTYNFNVTVNGDAAVEPDETFTVKVSNVSGASVTKGQGTGTILNDDTPLLSIGDAQTLEGNSGTTTLTFTVTLSPASNQTVTVNYSTADGTATTAGNDYRAASGSLTFNPGDTQKTISVTVNGDTLVEPDETFSVILSGASGAIIGTGQGKGRIQNDDVANLVISQVYQGGGLSNATYTNDFVEIFNRGTTTVDISVTPLSVQFLSTNGSAWSKTDITSNTSKTIAPGKYLLVQESGGSTGAALPTPDATGTINITSTVSGKVALVLNTTLLTGSCPGDDGNPPLNPSGSGVIDFVGYGGNASTANHCYEGSGPAPYTTGNNAVADFRKGGGCVDANDNSQDFTTAVPNPRNSASPTNDCSAADLSITKTDSPDPVDAGGKITYTLTVTNNSSFNSAQNVVVTDAVPTNTTFVSVGSTPQGWNRTDSTATGQMGTITYTNSSLAASATATFTITVKVDSNAANNSTISNTATISSDTADSDAGNNLATQQTTVHTPADLSIRKTVDNATPNVGDSVNFTITLSNAGPYAATGVAVSDQLPSGLTFVSANTTQGSYNSSTGVWAVGNVSTGNAVANLTIKASVATAGTKTNTAQITNSDQADPTTSNNQSSATVTATQPTSADLSVTKVDSPDPVAIGNDITYTITVNNSGPDAAANATLSDTVPASTTFRSITPPNGWTCPTQPGQGGTGSISCTKSSFATGSAVFTLVVRVNTSVTDGSTISNTASLSSSTTDPNGNNNSATQTTTVKQPLLVISQIYPGGGNANATYTNDFIEIFNRGTTTVDFSVTNYSVQYISTSGSTWTKTDLTSGKIAPGQYFLIQEASGGSVGASLPTPDAVGNINLATSSAKVALVLGTTLLTGSCPGDDGAQPFNPNKSTIIDFTGYSGNAATTSHCYEGSAPAPFASGANNRSTIRTSSCTDTNNNSADFSNPTSAPTARSSATATVTCP